MRKVRLTGESWPEGVKGTVVEVADGLNEYSPGAWNITSAGYAKGYLCWPEPTNESERRWAAEFVDDPKEEAEATKPRVGEIRTLEKPESGIRFFHPKPVKVVEALTADQVKDIADIMAALEPFVTQEDNPEKPYGDGYRAVLEPIRVVSDAHTEEYPEVLGWITNDQSGCSFTQTDPNEGDTA